MTPAHVSLRQIRGKKHVPHGYLKARKNTPTIRTMCERHPKMEQRNVTFMASQNLSYDTGYRPAKE
jgi:hypothetical protein